VHDLMCLSFLGRSARRGLLYVSDNQKILMKKIYVNLDEFKTKIVNSDEYCFICLEHNSSKSFNDEHVLPKWILKKFKLFDKTINLPNNSKFRYGQYVIPCCVDCNTRLSEVYEIPLSNLLKLPFDEIIEQIKKDQKIIQKIYHWMSLIFIKTHIKTTLLKKFLNPKRGTGKIGDDIEWAYLHHIYLMSRVHYTNATVNNDVYGSTLIFSAMNEDSNEGFDFVDSWVTRSIFIKIDEIAIICCLDDGKAGISFISRWIDKLESPLHPLQLKEILAHLGYINLNLAERPTFQSRHNKVHQIIEANYPESPPSLVKKERQQFQIGDILDFFAKSHYMPENKNNKNILAEIKAGTRGFLFDSDGKFYKMS